MEDKNLEVVEQVPEDEDRLDMLIGLVSWIPSSLKSFMNSDSDVDLIYLSMMFMTSILILRFKNDKVIPFLKGGK